MKSAIRLAQAGTACIPALLNARGNSGMPLDSMVAAFVGVNVVPMDRDTVLVDQTVLVRNGRIESIRPERNCSSSVGR